MKSSMKQFEVDEIENKEDHLIVGFPKVPRSKMNESKKVSFSPTSTLHQYFYNFDDESEDECREKHESWYKKSDYKSFRKNTRNEVVLARLLNNSFDFGLDGDEVCVTGIEHYLCDKLLMAVVESRKLHKQAVLDEHEHQVRRGENPYVLRSVSLSYSKAASERAKSNAQKAKTIELNVPRRGSVSHFS